MDKTTVELLQSHLAKARSKLKTAHTLMLEGAFDDVASRAYYSAFHAAQAVLLTEGLHADTHSGVRTLFGLHFAKPGKLPTKMGRYLSNLKDDREEGDYDTYSSLDEETAKNALREATEFLAEAEKYLNPFLTQ